MKKNQYIIDSPIELNPDKDLLKTGIYAKALKKAILSSPVNQSFIIGLFGSWGAGKSSIVHTTEKQIISENPSIKFITYDAWKYSNDSFRRMFLLTMQESLELEPSEEMRRFYQAENFSIDPPKISKVKKFFMSIFLLAWLGMVIYAICNYWNSGEISSGLLVIIILQGLVAFAESTFKFFSGMEKMFEKMQINVQKEKVFAPEQFEDCFSEMANKSLKTDFHQNFLVQGVRSVLEYIKLVKKRYEKLVIVFDNIDRCHSSMAYELLTDIKTFLSHKNLNIVYVIPVDDAALQKHLFSQNSNDNEQCDKAKEEFLRKLFTVALRIKQHQTTEIYEYTLALCKNHNIHFNGDTLAIISKNFASNPRRIIQLINNLLTELSLYEESIASQYETQICSMLIIREEFGSFFNHLLESPNLILPNANRDTQQNKLLEDFLRTVERYFVNIDTGIINQILTNSNACFSNIPDEIKQAVTTYNSDAIIAYLKSNEPMESQIRNLIMHTIESEQLFSSDVQKASWLDFIAKIHEDHKFDLAYYSKLETSLIEKTKSHALSFIQNADFICSLARSMDHTHINSLTKKILNYLTAQESRKNENFSLLYSSLIDRFDDDITLKTLAPTQEELTLSGIEVDKKFNFTDNHYQYLFSDKLITGLINIITKLSSSEFFNAELQWILSHKKSISDNLIKSYVAKILELSPFNTSKLDCAPEEGNLNDYGLRQINDHLSCLPDYTAACQPLIDAVCKTNFISLDHYRQRVTTSYFEKRFEIIAHVEIDDCVEFFYHVYRFNQNANADFIKMIATKLFELSPARLETYLVELIQNGFTLSPLYDIIINKSSFKSEQSIAIMNRMISAKKKDGLHMIKEQQAENLTSKLKSRLNENSIEQAILALLKIETLQETVISSLAKEDAELIATAPVPIQEHCVSIYSKDNHSTFRETFNYLKLVAKNGKAEQKKNLISATIADINSDNKNILVANQLDILLSLDANNKENCKRIIRFAKHLQCEISDNEEIISLIDQIIAKFSIKI